MTKDIPFYPDPTYRPPSKPTKIPTSEGPENIDISSKLILILRKILCFKEE